jgi:signal transduction histidine kinase
MQLVATHIKRSWPQRRHLVVALTPMLLSFLLMCWAVWYLVQVPRVGAYWSASTGIVDGIEEDGPAVGLLHLGDRILTINGAPIQEAHALFTARSGADVQLAVLRNNVLHLIQLPPAKPALATLLNDFVPLVIALSFWALSGVVVVFAQQGSQRWLVFVFAQVMSMTLASGAVSATGPLWTVSLFHVLLWWVGPLALVFHLRFPSPTAGSSGRQLILGLFSIALLGTLLDPLMGRVALSVQISVLSTMRLLWLAACLFGAVFALVWTYRHTSSVGTRQHVGLVALGGIAGFLPFLTLSLLPEVLLGQPLLPFEISFLFLLFVPLTYGYAIFRYRLLPLDRYVNRGFAALLAGGVLGGGYLLVYAGLRYVLPAPAWQQPGMPLLLAALVGMTGPPLYRRMRGVVDRLLYGGWHDYRTAVQYVVQHLEPGSNEHVLTQTLCENVGAAMQLQGVALWLADAEGTLQLAGFVGEVWLGQDDLPLALHADSRVSSYLHEQTQAIAGDVLKSMLDNSALASQERRLLRATQTHLWLPLVAERLMGYLVVAPKRGSEAFSRTDRDILQVVARQASNVLHTARLLADLRQHTANIKLLHGELLQAREAERTRIAYDLHDDVVQGLLGLKYRVEQLVADRKLASEQAGDLLDDVLAMAHLVRQICTDLRPPTLDTLGLVGAVRSLVRTMQRRVDYQIRIQVEGDETLRVPDELATCLYRVVQEALHNIEKHADAEQVHICLALQAEAVCITITDDGQGFTLPSQRQLLDAHHYGLVGLRERVTLLNGSFEVRSTPEQGASLRACVPLTPSATPGVSSDRRVGGVSQHSSLFRD